MRLSLHGQRSLSLEFVELMEDLAVRDVSDLLLDRRVLLVWAAQIEAREDDEGAIVREGRRLVLVALQQEHLHAACMERRSLGLEKPERLGEVAGQDLAPKSAHRVGTR